MASSRYLFSSESVSNGHPDKLADQISDTILDSCLTTNPLSRVACECCVGADFTLVCGEISPEPQFDIAQLAKEVAQEVGYAHQWGLDWQKMQLYNQLKPQSPDIRQGVDLGGAGDQGMMFGFACSESPELMPAPLIYAHKLMMRSAELRRKPENSWMGPDGKCQVTVEYEGYRPLRIPTVVFSQQHSSTISNKDIQDFITDHIIKPTLAESGLLEKHSQFLINRTGRFVSGGPQADVGLTGRKIIVDSYGGAARHGGGACSGKDPTKVDRSAAYMARKAAKNVVAAGLAKRCEIQLSYAIGEPKPVAISLQTFNTEQVEIAVLERAIKEVFDFSVEAIIQALNLRRPIYRATASFGHFGRSQFSWEACDKAEALQRAIR